MRLCKNCARFSKACRVAKNSEKCVKCVRLICSCDLALLNTIRWKRLKKQRRKLKTELKESYARQQKLLRQINVLKKKQRVMINDELKNIEKLKREERHIVVENVIFLINVIFEQIVFLNDFEKWSFISLSFFDDSFEVFSDNSWDCFDVFMCCLL